MKAQPIKEREDKKLFRQCAVFKLTTSISSALAMDKVQKRLKEIEEAQKEIQARVSESLEVLGDIEDSINEVKTRQVQRMRADGRVDESIVDQVKGED
jgi:hypothetical protein